MEGFCVIVLVIVHQLKSCMLLDIGSCLCIPIIVAVIQPSAGWPLLAVLIGSYCHGQSLLFWLHSWKLRYSVICIFICIDILCVVYWGSVFCTDTWTPTLALSYCVCLFHSIDTIGIRWYTRCLHTRNLNSIKFTRFEWKETWCWRNSGWVYYSYWMIPSCGCCNEYYQRKHIIHRVNRLFNSMPSILIQFLLRAFLISYFFQPMGERVMPNLVKRCVIKNTFVVFEK